MGEGSGDRIRVLIADDHRFHRDVISRLVAAECEVVGEAKDGESLVAMALRTKPQVILLDIVMRGADGLSAVHELARKLPSAKLLVVSQYQTREYVREAIKEGGVAGYFLKTEEPADNILPAIHAVLAGGQYFSPSISRLVVEEMNHPTLGNHADGLTKREREVLRLIAEGYTTKEIASRLNISPKTAQVHRDNLKQKLNLHGTADITRYAVMRKLIRVD